MLWRGVLWLLLIVCLVPVAQAQEDYFVVASVSSSTPYVGQQVTYIFRLYSTVSRTNRGSVVDPSFDGFWEHEFNTVQQYNTIVNGQSYEVKERRVALYPTYAGNIRIDPTAFVIPDDPLQAGEVLFTEAVDVQVQPLPAQDDLAGFNGAVGQLEMQPTLDRQTTTVGEPLTLRLTVRGSANLEQLTAPQLPQTEAWRIYANPAAFVAEETEGLLVGEKIFEWLFTPLLAGQQNLPEITLTYFDPEVGAYQTLSTVPFAVEVLPAEEAESPAESVVVEAERLALKPVPATLGASAAGPGGGFWLLWAVPPLLAAAVWWRTWRQRQQNQRGGAYRRSQALRQAQQVLASARKAPAQDQHRIIRAGIIGYFADKLDAAASELNPWQVEAAMQRQGLDPDLRREVLDYLEQADQGLYAPVEPVNAQELARHAAATLAAVDAEWEAR